MKLEHTFTVAQDADDVFAFFADIPAVASCMPGADAVEGLGEDRYSGRLSVRLGPMTYAFAGEAKVTADARTRTGSIEGTGIDERGRGRATATVTYRLTATDDGTRVEIGSDIALAGLVAQFGRTGIVKDVSDRLIGRFAACVAARLGGEAPGEGPSELRPLPLIASSLRDAAVRRAKGIAGRDGSDDAMEDRGS